MSPLAQTLRIPKDLLPADGRFGCGPALIRPASIEAITTSGIMGTSHRQAPVKDLVGRIREGLTELFTAPDHRVVLGNGGSTTFWAIATACLVRKRSAHAVFGEFGSKFAQETTNAPFLDSPFIAEGATGTLAVLDKAVEGVDAYAWPQQETSTGVVSPVRRVPDTHDALTLVDATSIAGSVQVDVSQTDAYYFAPQKALGSDGGLWVALMSPAAIERAEELCAAKATPDNPQGRWIPAILDLKQAIDNSVKNQTLNTPALATLIMLEDQIRWLLDNGGLPFAQARVEESSQAIYHWAASRSWANPYVANPDWRSPVVCTIDLDEDVSATAVLDVLRANGIVDLGAYRNLGRNQLRIGVFPNTDPQDAAALIACVDWVVQRL
ncbi:MAG: phosphoserine transaminase [Actinomycetaceae bacterium]|nr:phosphoserine transaminase [Actinomycetaceae bacterium]